MTMSYFYDPILGKGRSADGAQRMSSELRQATVIPAGAIVYDTDTGVLYYGNGESLGGIPLHTTSTDSSFVYGLDKDMSSTSTAGTKVVLNHSYDYNGAPTALRYHAVDSFAQTPAHSFRSVLRDLANGVDVCTLDVSDSTKRADGTPLTADEMIGKWTTANGTILVDFMVRIPITYWRIDHYSVEVDGQTHNHVVWLVSNQEFVDSAPHPWFYTGEGGETLAPQYVSKFRAVVCSSDGTPKTQSAESTPVSFTSTDLLRSIMGYRPAASISRANFRVGAGNNHANLSSLLFREWLTLMTAIDGGNFDVQTSISYGFANCSAYDYAALRKTGRSAIFGNQTGEVTADDDGLDADLLTMKNGGSIWNVSGSRVVSFCWRGIEDPWGGLWEQADGCQKYQANDADTITCSDDSVYTRYWAGNNGTTAYAWRNANEDVLYSASATPAANAKLYTDNTKETESALTVKAYTENYDASGYWVTNDTTKYSSLDTDKGHGQPGETFPSRGYTGDSIAWVSQPWPKSSTYIKTFDEHSFLIKTGGGGSNTYFGDNFYNDQTAGARLVVFGGSVAYGLTAGVGFAGVTNTLGAAVAIIGCRLSAPAQPVGA